MRKPQIAERSLALAEQPQFPLLVVDSSPRAHSNRGQVLIRNCSPNVTRTTAPPPELLRHWPDDDRPSPPGPDGWPGAEPTPMERRWLADLEAQL